MALLPLGSGAATDAAIAQTAGVGGIRPDVYEHELGLIVLATRLTVANSPYTATGIGTFICDCSGGSITFTPMTGVNGQACLTVVKRADATYAAGNVVNFAAPAGQTFFVGPLESLTMTEQGQSQILGYDGNGSAGTWNLL